MQKKVKAELPYVVVFLVPWVLIIIHSVVRESWLSGEGSILAGDAGNLCYQMYAELWEKLHHGGSLVFTWNAGAGMDFLVSLFDYMLSPFTLLILLFPKSMIANVLQFSIVMKWSIAAVTMLYFFQHSAFNRLRERKTLVSIALALVYVLGNAMISSLAHPVWLDILAVFPLLLLMEEKMIEGKGFKRFLFLLLFCLICNYQVAIPMTVFLTVWYGMLYSMKAEKNKRGILKYAYCVVAAVFASFAVLIPCVAAASENSHWKAIGEYFSVVKMPYVHFLQRFFAFDSLLLSQASEPMLYCGAGTISIALLYLFISVNWKEKCVCIVIALMLGAGMMFGGIDIIWHVGIQNIGAGNSYAFLLTFLLAFMAMRVLIYLEDIRIWQVAAAVIVLIGAVVLGFFKAEVLLEYYVYLASILLCVFILFMLFFFCRKSIHYKNMLVLFVLLSVAELLANAFYQLEEYNMYPMETVHYHAQNEILAHTADLQAGQRAASAQVMPNQGMYLNMPLLSGEFEHTDDRMRLLFERLGMAVTDDYAYYFGGSPLLNLMFNVRYGYAAGEQVYSDTHKLGENGGYTLYEMERTASLGYMVDLQVAQWKTEASDPFSVQNDYVKCAAGGEEIFGTIMPEVTCSSAMGRNSEHENETHVHSADEETEEHAAFHGSYDDKGWYHYEYSKMYAGDAVKMEFESDGTTDYYVFVDSDTEAYFQVSSGNDILYTDEIGSRQKTFHIGVMEKGRKVTIETNARADFDAISEPDILSVSYRFAAFDEENYQKAYENLTRALYEITDMGNNTVKGKITTKNSGIMMTGIPALKGFRVYVDGNESEYEVVGGALLGVPIDEGTHEIEFVYHTPYVEKGLMGTLFGLMLIAGYCIWDYCLQKRMAAGSSKEPV